MTELELARNYALYTNRNIFLTGKAGTGKTTFLKHLRDESHKRTIVVAPTGVAAINAGGSTIHSFFQLAPGLYLPDGKNVGGRDTKNRYSFGKNKLNIIRSLDLLVIDEISMVRADLLDAVSDVLQRLRHSDRPFGGVQLLLIGDLQQLAPVTIDSEWDVLKQFYSTPYFFSSRALLQTDFTYIELHHVFRQEDQHFVTLLNRVRDGQMDASTLAALNSRYQPRFKPPEGQDWITLVTHNYQAQQINSCKLEELPSTPISYVAHTTGEFPEMAYPTDVELTLKVGAQVMFCKNDPSFDKAFFNGKIGRVEELSRDGVTVVCMQHDEQTGAERCERIVVSPLTWENFRYVSDATTGQIREERIGTFTQIPLRTAWAITIHKSQGLTFDRAIINAGRAFSYGQVYVALSRCRSLEGMVLSTPISSGIITVDPEVLQFNDDATSRIPTPDTFLRDRRAYVEELLCQLFDFRTISMRLRSYARLVSEYTGYLFPTYAQAASECATQVDTALFSVGVRFQQQIHQLIQLSSSATDNSMLQQRVGKGMAYYCNETARILGEFLDMDRPDTDNKHHAEVLTREYDQLRADFNEKMSIYVACLNGFTFERYWDAKAKASMTQDKPRVTRASKRVARLDEVSADTTPQKASATKRSKRIPKAEIDYSTILNQSLYNSIRVWRKRLATERRLPDAYVMSLKAVIGIANKQPRNIDELLSVPGIGQSIANEYGSELLTLVSENRLD